MTNRLRSRLERIEGAAASRPIDERGVDRAIQHLREAGELPEHQRTAEAVMDRVLNPRMPPPPIGPEKFRELIENALKLASGEHSEETPRTTPKRDARRELFEEAVFGDPQDRRIARRLMA